MMQDFTSADKRGYLRLGFELDSQRSILRDWERHAPTIVQQALYFDEEWEELPPMFISSSEKGTGREEILTFIEEALTNY